MVRKAAAIVKKVLPYAADTGAAAYAAIALFALVVAAAEIMTPGSVSGVVAPQSLVVLMAVAGGLALADVSAPRASRKRLGLFAALGAVAVAVAFWAAWDYFGPVPEFRGRLAAFTAGVVGLLFAAAASPAPEDV